MRLFAGVELAPEVRSACAAAAAEMASRLREAGVRIAVRWTPEQNLHFTLWFFGEVEEGTGAGIAAALAEPWALPKFQVIIGSAGAFPPSGPPRILWLGLLRGQESFAALHRELARRLAPLGFPAERRPYHPHVTIGRVKETRDAARVRAILQATAMRPQPMDVGAVTLFQSRLSPVGSVYEPLLRVPLI